jgi:hypothetical protein
MSYYTIAHKFKDIFNSYTIKLKKKKKHTLKSVLKYNLKIVERDKIDTPNTHVHDHSLSWLGTITSMKRGRAKLVLWAKSFPNSLLLLFEM